MKKNILILAAMLMAGQSQAQKFDLQGQRGARGIMPENTIPGMIKALDLGVNTLVMNAVISKDKQVVLSQEPYFNAEISLKPYGKAISLKDQKKYNIYKMNYEEVKKFDVGSKIHNRYPGQQKFKAYKPLLEETIDSVESYVKLNKLAKPNYSIETKLIPKGDGEFQPEPSEFVDLIMEVVKRKKLEKRVTIQSFDIRTLQYLHEHYPKIKTGLLIDEKENFEINIEELGFKPTVYSPYSVLVGKSLVDRCHEAGIKIIPWTINSTKEMKYLIDLGVDGLVTDYPNLFKPSLLKED
ncbi:glycerophosphodiester phosphodiesterase family protein [Pedobacter gandavensis]|uniref:glycerophosphodiester phosphodiesterase family protein n=1 Tax=Pedobacter gandavensis TaxID=2679963 RepID=UPI002478CC9C|nr:glycerophosphodiester phosphodiesterase family protein [Pedobacter gandavensis]WGQ08254.1 glycerophosphodiester phosphodiesterase family protein [Pedobacter gandavensis]